jgi:hypothetical protein
MWHSFRRRQIRLIALLIAFVGLGVASCSTERQPEVVTHTGPISYADADTLFPRLRFADGQVSLNDRCPVRKVKLNRRMPPLYVNGRPIGFC